MPNPYHAPRKSQRRQWLTSPILWGSLVALIFCFGLYFGYFQPGQTPQVEPVTEEPTTQPTREIILYFASGDGQKLMAENRLIDECQSELECLNSTINALLEGPHGDLVPILPAQAALRDATITGNLVAVDFSQELIAAHPGGTQSELLTVYGLADTVAVNFPHLRQLQVLVEGRPVATLKGHVDLRQPVNPDFSLVDEGVAPAGRMDAMPAGRDE
jgi:spore germination protein GerM